MISPPNPRGNVTGAVDVTVTTAVGTSAVYGGDQFTYAALPAVTSLSPSAGPVAGGTAVIITGTNLANATAVYFGTNVATITSDSATQLVVTSPVGLVGPVDVTVVTAGGTSGTSAADKFTYVAAPTVASISPIHGPAAGGTTVTITGTHLANAQSVQFGAIPALIISDSDNQIVVASPAGVAGTVDVTVSTAGGTSATSSADLFTYVAAPTVTGISPAAGPVAGGTTVTITGMGLANASAVKFGTALATIISDSDNQLVVTSPANPAGSVASTVDVTVVTIGGISSTLAADQFTYAPVPAVTSISPAVGVAVGGTTVTITGTCLATAKAVYFGSNPATIVSDTATQLVVSAPAGVAGTVDVTVQTAGGTSPTSVADKYTYVAAPTVTSIAPTKGPVSGGTTVTIVGTNLGNATAVNFGIVAATIVSDTANQLVVTSPVWLPGSVDVTVVTVGGTSATSSADLFTYVAVPVVTGVSPAAGPVAGGTTVTIIGAGLANASAVKFGGVPATIISDSDSQIVVRSPANVAGTVDVTVVTVGGTSAISALDQFTYAPIPAVASLSPSAGPVAGGITVTITGAGLANATAVKFGTALATVVSDSPTQLVVTSPAGLVGTVDVTVVTAGGVSALTAADHYTYVAAPTVTGVSPMAGPATGGTTVTITGTNLANAWSVHFGTTLAAILSNTGTQLVVTCPAGIAGTVDVAVTTAGGTSAAVVADQFTYIAAPTVTGVSPAAGPASGGTTVTITGANLANATAVKFGTALATIISDANGQLVVTSPANPAGLVASTVDITVITLGGTSATLAADQFTYAPARSWRLSIPRRDR